jgi:hypothetical protein
MIQEGSVFYLKGSEDRPHYHIIVFRDPLNQDKRLIACYLSSSQTLPDLTTTFQPNEDFFITRFSWVKYRNAKILSEMDLHLFNHVGNVNEKVLAKIQTGLRASLSRVPREVKDLLLQWDQDRLFGSSKSR